MDQRPRIGLPSPGIAPGSFRLGDGCLSARPRGRRRRTCPRSESHRVLLLTRQAHHSACFEGVKVRQGVAPCSPRLQLGARTRWLTDRGRHGRRRARTSCRSGHHARSRRGRRLGRFIVQQGFETDGGGLAPHPHVGGARLSRAARRARPVHRPESPWEESHPRPLRPKRSALLLSYTTNDHRWWIGVTGLAPAASASRTQRSG